MDEWQLFAGNGCDPHTRPLDGAAGVDPRGGGMKPWTWRERIAVVALMIVYGIGLAWMFLSPPW